jgi:hypothetical protein
VKSDRTGWYNFVDLAVGKYVVKAEASNFETYKHTGIVVDAESRITVNLALSVGSTTQQVTVNAQAAQVNTESAEVGETITAKSIEDLPLNGRDAGSLITLAPGVSGYGFGNDF